MGSVGVCWISFGLSDYEFYSGFDNEMMHKYFVYSFCFILQVMSRFIQVQFLPARKKQVMQSCIFVCSSSCRTVTYFNTGLRFLNR